MRRRPPALAAKTLQLFGLMVAFVLLVAAKDFASQHPALSAILVFAFSLPYLGAALVTQRAHFLYGLMLLGATSYFLASHALGAPGASFPLLSVPLVWCLLLVARRLEKTLPPSQAPFPQTVRRAMNITILVFSVWALKTAPSLMAQPGWLRYVAGMAFVGFAGLYLYRCAGTGTWIHAYAFAAFLILGAVFFGWALGSLYIAWAPLLVAAALIALAGTEFHRERSFRWSRHFYFSCAAALAVALVFSVLRLSSFAIALALASLVLWTAYRWLSSAVGDVRLASTAERGAAKCFFLGALALSVPMLPIILLRPGHLGVSVASLIFAVTFAWIARERINDRSGVRNFYALPAILFVSAGLMGIGRPLPGWAASAWSLVIPPAVVAGLGLLHRFFDKAERRTLCRSLAEAAVFPALLAWYIPLVQGQTVVALVSAAIALGIVLALGKILSNASFLYYAVGPAGAGVLVALAILLGAHSVPTWAACIAAACAAGAYFALTNPERSQIARGAANLTWLVLSLAATVIAAAGGVAHALFCVIAVGCSAVLMASRRNPERARDVFDLLVQVLTVLATVAAVVLGPVSRLGAIGAGVCLLILAAAYVVAATRSRSPWHACVGEALVALSALLIIFGVFSGIDARLFAGAVLVLAFFVLDLFLQKRFSAAARGAVVVGHVTSLVLAFTALTQAWPQAPRLLPLATAFFVAIYGFMPQLRRNAGFRFGAAAWMSLLVLFSLSALGNTPYRRHIPLVSLLAFVWLALGYLLQRSRTQSWSAPLYVCAALLAAFCGITSLFGPATVGSWRVFLVNGVAFAALFLILRKDIFVYLVTLSLALMAYDWVKSSTTHFTQDLLFYLVTGIAFLGVLFLLPYLKTWIARAGLAPMFSIFTWRGMAIVSVPVVLVALLILSTYSVKITEHPKFCTSCHYMDDYYTSWQHSAHKDVACVQCHYEPGVTATIEGKMAGMVQLVKYVSHSYTSKPHALISNNSCMRNSSCHAEMDHSKQALLFRGKIKFRHDKHLSLHPRGKTLNCVSCHGQAMESEHISVTPTTCVTCHFYGRGDNPVAAGACDTCHTTPEVEVTFAGGSFNHGKFLEGKAGVQCVHCHSQVTQGDGSISVTRCNTCHLDSSTIRDIEDQSEFHLVHVSKGHFDCLQCHDEIKHGVHPMVQQMITANCETCHGGKRHSIQEKLYAGEAVPQMQTEPDVMYVAGVACDGCHTDEGFVRDAAMTLTGKKAGAKQCAECHSSKRYGDMLEAWQEDTRERLDEIRPALAKLQEQCISSEAPGERLDQARRLLESAQMKVSQVVLDGSLGAHNYIYVSDMLDTAEEELRKCRSLLVETIETASRGN